MRFEPSNPNLPQVKRGSPITLWIDGRKIAAFSGETIAAVLFAEGLRLYRHQEGKTAVSLGGYFCGMGVCYGCLVSVDGLRRRACLTQVKDGMIVYTQPSGYGGSG